MEYKLGVNAGAYIKSKVDENLYSIANAGFDAFFTGWKTYYPIAKWADIASKKGLIYQSIHAPFDKVDKIWYGGDSGIEYVEYLKKCVDACKDVAVPLMIVHPFIGFNEHEPTDIGLELYSRLIDHADKKNISIAFENVEGEEYLAALMQKYRDAPCVGFCWDTGHEQCYNAGKDMVSLYGDKLFGTHFNDNNGCLDLSDVTWKDDLHLLPFDGKIDWQGVMNRIRRHGFDGILTFELTTSPKPDRDTSLHDSYAAMSGEEFYREAYNRAKRVAAL